MSGSYSLRRWGGILSERSTRFITATHRRTISTFSCDIARAVSRTEAPAELPVTGASGCRKAGLRQVWLWLTTELTQSPWFLNCGKFFQPSFLHWSLLVGWGSDEVKFSV